MRQRSRGRVASAAVAAMWAVAALPGQAYAAGESGAYAFEPGARSIKGAEVSTDAPDLEAGSVYRSTIKPGEKLYYSLDLGAQENAYVSAVAVPGKGEQVSYADGITVSVRDSTDLQCSSESARFASAEFPRPIAAYAHRVADKDSSSCQGAGTYNVLIERDSKSTSGSGAWDLELRHVSEPQPRSAGTMPTDAPEDWPSASPAPPSASPGERHGGTSYYDATGLETGVWKDDVAPGQTRFYRVPLSWGQQVFATVDLGNSSATGEDTYVGSALALSLDNPAHGHVDSASPLAYSGKPTSVSLDPVPPVAYRNRHASDPAVSAMRFAGWYYLSVSLSPKVAEAYGQKPIPMRLKVTVDGQAKGSPYAGDAGIFSVTDDDRDMARTGGSGPQAARSNSMKTLAASGIGAGTVLVLGLGAWTLIARRRAVPSGADTGSAQRYGGSPPQGW